MPGFSQLIQKPPQPLLGTPIDWSNPLTRGMTAHWPFNEASGTIVSDCYGKTYPITYNLSPLWKPGGLYNTQNNTGATTNILYIPTSLFNITEFTISYWICHDSLAADDYSYDQTVVTFYIDTTNYLRFTYSFSDSAYSCTVYHGGTHYGRSGLVITDHVGKWTHVAVSYSSGLNAKIYTNGVYGDTGTYTAASATGASFLLRRSSTSNKVGAIDGILGPVSVWRRALTETEIKSLYTNPSQIYRSSLPYYYYIESGNVPIEVQADCDDLTLTEYSATISYDIAVAATCDDLTLTEYDAVISYVVNVAATCDDLTLTSYQAEISYDLDIAATCDELVLTSYLAEISYDITVAAACDDLTLTTYPAGIGYDQTIAASCDDLTLTSYPAEISYDLTISATCDELVLAEHNPTISYVIAVAATCDELTLTEHNADVSYDVTVVATCDELVLETFNANVYADTNVMALCDELILAEYSAKVRIGDKLLYPPHFWGA